MRIFGFYKEEEDAVDLSLLPFMPQPDRVVLFGRNLLVLKRMMGMVHGFSGFALIFGPLEVERERVVVKVEGPVFVSEGGFFSDDPGALVSVGLPLDIPSCRRFVDEGDYDGFVPVSGAERYGGKVRINLSPKGLEVEVEKGGSIAIEEMEKPDRFTVAPELLGPLWRVKLLALPPHKKARLYAVERWASGFRGLR